MSDPTLGTVDNPIPSNFMWKDADGKVYTNRDAASFLGENTKAFLVGQEPDYESGTVAGGIYFIADLGSTLCDDLAEKI